MMDLNEAIEHAKDKAQELYNTYMVCGWSDEGSCDGKSDCRVLKNGKDKGCIKCCEEHGQLASWLEELKAYKIADGSYLERCPLKEEEIDD